MTVQAKYSILKKWGSIEQTSYWVVWAILGFLPLIFWDFSDPIQRERLIGGWMRIFPFFLIFLIHNFILLPQLFMKKNYLAYAVLTILLILAVNYWFIFSDALHNLVFNLLEKNRNTPSPGTDGARAYGMHRGQHGGPGGPGGRGGGYGGARYWRWHKTSYLIYTYNILISLLVVGFNTVLKFATQWLSQEQIRKETEKVAAESQLNALQNQVSPHFFMNTLNNIHALIEYNKEDAQEAVLRLSKMMRYLLYESDHGKTSLRKEIEFMRSYIELMKLRIQPGVDLRISFPDPVPDVEIHSLLTISFLENAFKHGIDPKNDSFIHIRLEVEGNRVLFNCRNSKSGSGKPEEEVGGIGIINARKRLDLLFGKDYSLEIFDREHEFEIVLNFPLA